MNRRTIVVLGGALAGPTAAARARETDDSARIILIERNRRVSYALCGLAYHLSGEVSSLGALDRERSHFFHSFYDIEVRTETEVTAIDASKRVLHLQAKGVPEKLPYDAMVFAMGADSPLPAHSPSEVDNLVTFRTLDDLERINASLSRGKRVAILGGGIMGLEAADGLIRGGAQVTVIEREQMLLPQFDRMVAMTARRALDEHAAVITGATVDSFETDGARIGAIRLSKGARVETDLVISTIGLVPRTALLKAAGARLSGDGTVVIDDRSATSLPGVYACGVCVSAPQVLTGRLVWWAQAALADKTAQVAGANAAGGIERLGPALGSVVLRVLDTCVGRAGLSCADAAGHFGTGRVGVTTIFAPSHERYYPRSRPMLVRLCWSRTDGRVLGAELSGGADAGVDKRIDCAASAIAGGMSVTQLASLDLAFAPPFAAARDPLNVAATVASQIRSGLGQAIEPEELALRRGEMQLVDVREGAEEARLPPIAGSIRIPLSELREKFHEIDRNRPTVTVSNTGRRGWLAARLLMQRGFKDVCNLSGGLQAWSLSAFKQGAAR